MSVSVLTAALLAGARADSAQAWLTLLVAITILLTFIGAVARILYKIMQGLGPDEDGHSLRDRVRNVEGALNNGLRTDIRTALNQVEKNAADVAAAKELAAEAVRVAAVADQQAAEGRSTIERAVNGLRADVDVYTNVVLSDRRRIKEEIRKLGGDLPDDE